MNNALKDYWESTKQKNKQGVVLSLNPIVSITHKGFINITHLEFLTEVMKNYGNYMISASDKYSIFLKDFYQNILNLSQPMETQHLDFFYQNAIQINKASQLKDSITKYLDEEAKKACEELNLRFYKINRANGGYHYFQSHKNRNLMITVYFARILEGNPKLLIMVELQGDLLQKSRQKLNELKLGELEKTIVREEFYSNTNNWAHFAVKEFDVSSYNLHSFGEFVVQCIDKSPIKSIFFKIERFLS